MECTASEAPASMGSSLARVKQKANYPDILPRIFLLAREICPFATWMMQSIQLVFGRLQYERTASDTDFTFGRFRNVGPSSESTDPSAMNVSRPAQSFTSIDVHLMSDEELKQALNDLPDGWIIISVDGQLTAIHEDELKPSRRRFVRTGNSRPPRPSSAGQGRWGEPSPHPRHRTSG